MGLKVSHFKIPSSHLGVNILWTVENFTQIGQGLFHICPKIVGFFDFSLTNSCCQMWQFTQTVQDFLVCCYQSVVKEGQGYTGICFKFHPSLGNVGKIFIAIVCRLRHKGVITNMTHLNVNLFQFRKGLLKILKSVKIALVITAKLVDVFASLLDCSQEILTVLV